MFFAFRYRFFSKQVLTQATIFRQIRTYQRPRTRFAHPTIFQPAISGRYYHPLSLCRTHVAPSEQNQHYYYTVILSIVLISCLHSLLVSIDNLNWSSKQFFTCFTLRPNPGVNIHLGKFRNHCVGPGAGRSGRLDNSKKLSVVCYSVLTICTLRHRAALI